MAGMAGVLFAHYTRFLSTNDFQFIRSFEIIIMIVLGGMGSLTGAVFGAIVVTLLPELLRQLPGDFSQYRLVVYSALLIIIMLTRPQGVLGTREFGLSWLKRSRRSAEGTEPVGGTAGVPIAENVQPSAIDRAKEVKNQ
jgi:branched-chain amino acid transport system permease protein